jgi:hypothetical protein
MSDAPPRFALFQDGKQISKAHSTEHAVGVEAFELGLAIKDKFGKRLAAGCEIRKVSARSTIAPKFAKGDRVKLSTNGLENLYQPNHHKHEHRQNMRGTITGSKPTGTGFYVLWDGRKSEDALHGDFLEAP